MKKFAASAVTLYGVPDVQQIIDDLIKLRKSRKLTQRDLGDLLFNAGISTEKGARGIVQQTEARVRSLEVVELFAWIEACGAKPFLWLAQYLNPEERRVVEHDRELIRRFRQALRIPERRRVLAGLLDGWDASGKRFDETPE